MGYHSGHSTQPQPVYFGAFRSEDQYPSICVCCASRRDHGNWWINICIPGLGSRNVALHVGESDGCAWGWCLGVWCCMYYGNWGACAHGAMLTQKLRKKHGFEENLVCGVCCHWWCQSCALAQEQHLIEHDQYLMFRTAMSAGPPRQTMRPDRTMM